MRKTRSRKTQKRHSKRHTRRRGGVTGAKPPGAAAGPNKPTPRPGVNPNLPAAKGWPRPLPHLVEPMPKHNVPMGKNGWLASFFPNANKGFKPGAAAAAAAAANNENAMKANAMKAEANAMKAEANAAAKAAAVAKNENAMKANAMKAMAAPALPGSAAALAAAGPAGAPLVRSNALFFEPFPVPKKASKANNKK